MFKDFEIICEQYDFSGVTDDINEVNFESDVEPHFLNSIDLTDYLPVKSSFSFKRQREDIDKVEDALRLYGSFDSLKLELSNLPTPRLFDFFALDNNDSNGFLRYKIFIKKAGKLIAQGVLKPNDINFDSPKDLNDRDIIPITIYSWEKEFKDYYSQGSMPELTEYWFNENFLGVNREVITLVLLVNGLFGIPYANVITDKGINNDKDLKRWRMARKPSFIAPNVESTQHLVWLQNGYDYIKSNNQYSPFDFFRKLCNGMGWLFYFKIIDNELKFVVRNRTTSNEFYGTRQIDVNDVIDWGTQYTPYRQKVKYIKIPTLEISGGSEIIFTDDGRGLGAAGETVKQKIRGKHDLVFCADRVAPRQDLIYFNVAKIDPNVNTGTDNRIKPYPKQDYGFSKFYSFENGNIRYENMFYDYVQLSGGSRLDLIERFEFNFETKFMLEIDAGHNDFNLKTKRRINLKTAEETDYQEGFNISNTDLIYCGSIPTAMYRHDDNEGFNTLYICNQDNSQGVRSYTLSDQFKKNFEPLLTSNSNLMLPVKVKGFNFDIDEIITFTNPNNEFPWGYEYEIESAEPNAITEETNYLLRRRVA